MAYEFKPPASLRDEKLLPRRNERAVYQCRFVCDGCGRVVAATAKPALPTCGDCLRPATAEEQAELENLDAAGAWWVAGVREVFDGVLMVPK